MHLGIYRLCHEAILSDLDGGRIAGFKCQRVEKVEGVMPPLRERYCKIKEPGCEIKFMPKRWWHGVCNNPACKRENARRCSRKWRKANPEYHTNYNQGYAKI